MQDAFAVLAANQPPCKLEIDLIFLNDQSGSTCGVRFRATLTIVRREQIHFCSAHSIILFPSSLLLLLLFFRIHTLMTSLRNIIS